jgi:hypothetical protein
MAVVAEMAEGGAVAAAMVAAEVAATAVLVRL